jgi:hypothetical protein
MENLYREKGGEKEFNCQEVQITLADLNELEEAMDNMALPETGGFFFGDDSYEDYEEWHKELDVKFIEVARKYLLDGKEIYYSSWW